MHVFGKFFGDRLERRLEVKEPPIAGGGLSASLDALITPTGTLRCAFVASAQRANLTGTTNPVPATLTVGGDSGTTSVKAIISH